MGSALTSCIYFHPEAYTTRGPNLMGRNAAGESFLRGFIKWSQSSDLWIFVEAEEHANAFKELFGACCGGKDIRFLGPGCIEDLRQVGSIFYPGPGLNKLSLNRSHYGKAAWSICGITHTTASERAMDSIVDIPTSPVESWDSLICPSAAVKGHVQVMLEAQSKFLKDHLGATCISLPEIPVIPLGVHTEDFCSTAEEKAHARSEMGIAEDELVVLYVGRLSFHAKAHPLVMYQALEAACRATGRKVSLVESGWHGNDHIKSAFKVAAEIACPSIRVIQLDGRKPLDRKKGWASADVFCSLPDSVQETFGIVPIEAMAAGLPVVVSDWDGYRDSVRDHVDGFRIPTVMPPTGYGLDLAQRHALGLDSYDRYCGYTSSLISVDIDAAIEAFIKLFDSKNLRAEMGTNGRERAKNSYDWRVIIAKYDELWESQRLKRLAAEGKIRKIPRVASQLDPFYAFQGYPTTQLGAEQKLDLRHSGLNNSKRQFDQLNDLAMVNFAEYIIPSKEESRKLLELLPDGAKTVNEILDNFPADRRVNLHRALVWFLKLGILKVV